MRFFLLILTVIIFVSCANTVDTSLDEPLEGDYRVSEIKGRDTNSGEVMVNFNLMGNRISGTSGCNQFSANFNQEGNKIEFSTPMNTRKYCEGKMETEKQLLSSLERAARVEQTGNEIIIYSEAGEALITLIKKDRSE